MNEQQREELAKAFMEGLGTNAIAVIYRTTEGGLGNFIQGDPIWLMGALDYIKRKIFVKTLGANNAKTAEPEEEKNEHLPKTPSSPQ